LPDTIQIHHADCRQFSWPKPIDIITADPIWGDLEAAEWLADFASGHLRDGGLLLVQTSTHALPNVMAILGAKLHYQWTLAMVFHHVNRSGAGGMFRSTWKPVVVFSKGPTRIPAPLCDTYTVHRGDKRYHRFQQPIEPWRFWLGRLAAPNALVAEPFAGSGTIPLICRDLGLRFVGTEADEKTYKVARGRVAGTNSKPVKMRTG
jgi:DNA methylase